MPSPCSTCQCEGNSRVYTDRFLQTIATHDGSNGRDLNCCDSRQKKIPSIQATKSTPPFTRTPYRPHLPPTRRNRGKPEQWRCYEKTSIPVIVVNTTPDRSGGFEDPWGVPESPPSSPGGGRSPQGRPHLPARKRSGDAAYHITEECERLFCETLKTVFLVEKTTTLEDSLVMDTRNINKSSMTVADGKQRFIAAAALPSHDLLTPSPSPDGRIYLVTHGMVREYVEMWDYAGGTRFRGFLAEKPDGQRSLFIFFDKEVIGKDLKPGLMALLELASSEAFDCSQLIVCVDREASAEDVKDTTRDLGWVGFELMMLEAWSGDEHCLSDRWIFVGIDL
nr:hypothetical protein CFP56_70526 [Quercus suber]